MLNDMRALASLLLPVVLLASCKLGGKSDKAGEAQAVEAEKKEWYDVAKLSAGLRPQVALDANRRLGVKDPADLTYYDLALSLGEDLKTFELEQTVWFTHTGRKPLSDLVFRVFANARKTAADPAPIVFRSGECVDSPCNISSNTAGVITVTPANPLAKRPRRRPCAATWPSVNSMRFVNERIASSARPITT